MMKNFNLCRYRCDFFIIPDCVIAISDCLYSEYIKRCGEYKLNNL